MKTEKWLAPAYYPKFRCKTDRCRNSCCSFRNIPITQKEYNRLVTMDCSKELDDIVQRSFISTGLNDENRFAFINHNYLGNCPMMEAGLCRIHLEMGEGYLPSICRLYPRSFRQVNDRKIISCPCSCEKILELLCEDEDSMNLVEMELGNDPLIHYQADEKLIKQIHSAFNQDLPLNETLVKICLLLNKKPHIKEGDVNTLNRLLSILEHISENNIRLEELSCNLIPRYRKDPALYKRDRIEFETEYPDWGGFFKRIIQNSLLFSNFPYTDERCSIENAYKGLCLSYGLMRVLCIGTFQAEQIDTSIDALAALYHVIDHTPFYYNASLFENDVTSFLSL